MIIGGRVISGGRTVKVTWNKTSEKALVLRNVDRLDISLSSNKYAPWFSSLAPYVEYNKDDFTRMEIRLALVDALNIRDSKTNVIGGSVSDKKQILLNFDNRGDPLFNNDIFMQTYVFRALQEIVVDRYPEHEIHTSIASWMPYLLRQCDLRDILYVPMEFHLNVDKYSLDPEYRESLHHTNKNDDLIPHPSVDASCRAPLIDSLIMLYKYQEFAKDFIAHPVKFNYVLNTETTIEQVRRVKGEIDSKIACAKFHKLVVPNHVNQRMLRDACNLLRPEEIAYYLHE